MAGEANTLNTFDCKSKKIDGNEANRCLIALMLIPREHLFFYLSPTQQIGTNRPGAVSTATRRGRTDSSPFLRRKSPRYDGRFPPLMLGDGER